MTHPAASPSSGAPAPAPVPAVVPAPADKKPAGVERVKLWIECIQGVVTILALLAGGVWFLLQRANKPQVKLDQTVTQRPVAGQPEMTLITLDVRATNVGKIKVDLEPGTVELMELNPEQDVPQNVPQSVPKIAFPLQRMTLEPGESDQAIFQTVNLPNSIHTIQVHSEYAVPGTKKYWNLLSSVDIGGSSDRKEAASSVH